MKEITTAWLAVDEDGEQYLYANEPKWDESLNEGFWSVDEVYTSDTYMRIAKSFSATAKFLAPGEKAKVTITIEKQQHP